MATLNSTNDILHTKLEAAEESIKQIDSLKSNFETSLKTIKKNHLKEMNDASSTIKTLEKSGKGLEKDIR